MPTLKHIDFEVPGFGEFAQGPAPIPSYREAVMALSPAGYWRLGDAAGEPALDETGAHTGAYLGGVTRGAPGAIAYDADPAASLDGVSGYIHTSAADLLAGLTECSIIFWMNYQNPAVTGDGAVVSQWQAAPGGHLVWVDAFSSIVPNNTNTLVFAVDTKGGAPGRVVGPDNLITPLAWDFYACTFDAADAIRLYKNGVQVAERLPPISSAIAGSASPLLIGNSSDPTSIKHLPALLDEVALFTDALSAGDIAGLFQTGIGRFTS